MGTEVAKVTCTDWTKKARLFLQRIAEGAIETYGMTAAAREAGFKGTCVDQPRKELLYRLLRRHSTKALRFLEKAGMSRAAALQIYVKALGPEWENGMRAAVIHAPGMKQHLCEAGLTEKRLAEILAGLTDAERVKVFADGTEVPTPDNTTRLKATRTAFEIHDAFPAQRHEIKGKIDHAHAHTLVPWESIAEAEKEHYDPENVIDVEPEPVKAIAE